MEVNRLTIETIAFKKNKYYYMLIAVVIIVFLIGVLSLSIGNLLLGFIFIAFSFIILLSFHFYNGKIKTGTLIINKNLIVINQNNKKPINIKLNEISHIKLLKGLAFDEFSLILAWGDGTDNYIQFHLRNEQKYCFRLYFKTEIQLNYLIYFLSSYKKEGIGIDIANFSYRKRWGMLQKTYSSK